MTLEPNYEPAQAAKTVDKALRGKWWKYLSVAERTALSVLIAQVGDQPSPDLDKVRAVLHSTGHTVSDDIERDVDKAIDLERSRREDILMAVALVLGHSHEYALTMKPRHLLVALRDKAMDADRCSTCPWERGTECGGARGVCEGNARPEVDYLIERVRGGFLGRGGGSGTLHEGWVG